MQFGLIRLLLVSASVALVAAHVTITPNQVQSGGTSIWNFQVGHSCNSTTNTIKVVIEMPANFTSMKPVSKVGWKLSREAVKLGYNLPSGLEALRYNYIWQVDTNIYQGLEDWAYDTMQVRVATPATIPAGSKFYVPVYQYCTGDLLDAWNSTTGGDSHVGDLPAPTVTVLAVDDIQFNPTQANVRALRDAIALYTAQLANITKLIDALEKSNNTLISSSTGLEQSSSTGRPSEQSSTGRPSSAGCHISQSYHLMIVAIVTIIITLS